MMKSLVIKLSSVAVLMLYVLSFVGVTVHSCSCTGDVCVALAIHQHDEHCCHHSHDHHCESCSSDDDHDGCCQENVYKITLSGDGEDDNVYVASSPVFDVAVYDTPYMGEPLFRTARATFRVHAPPHKDTDILRHICIVRV